MHREKKSMRERTGETPGIADIAVSPVVPSLATRARDLARELGLPLLQPGGSPPALILALTEQRLELRQTGKNAATPLFVDFAADSLAFRRKQAGSRKEAVARAVGIKGGTAPTVLDVTAGLGQDGFILASLGCRVHLVERSSVVAALLADGLRRGAEEAELAAIIPARLRLTRGDGLEILALWQGERPQVVCLDPMYPQRGKSALAKKEMRLLRLLVGDDQDSEALLAAALAVATRRVVVKRPRLAPPLAGPAADFSISGRSSRFDVYLIAPEK